MKNKFVTILENDDWFIDYCKETNRYRVSYFEDSHFVDDVCFDGYKEDEYLISPNKEKKLMLADDVFLPISEENVRKPLKITFNGDLKDK